jgi:pseudouridine-5'-phosphate glycosidase
MENGELAFHPEVKAALAEGRPVVALESTLITHGLAYPTNLETARAMEAAVCGEGAVPATVAILGGQITVGLTGDELEYLGTQPRQAVRKCSRRDLPIAMGRGEDAATTVAGTMVVAHKASIEVFATGGIGGVHRGHPFDVSSDLIELGRTPVTVVCSGAKAILDLPLTLEVLETQGVPIVGYSTDTLPAFYSRSSGLPVDVPVESPADVAAIVRARQALGLAHATLVTVPVPAAEALPREEAEAAIEEAIGQADAAGIVGKALTPFVLARIVEFTAGRSQRANVALLVNNARVAARIARALV